MNMNDLRTRYDEDVFNGMPGRWLLKPQEDHFWQLMCTNDIEETGRFALLFIMSECYDLKIRAHLYVQKRDKSGAVIKSEQIEIAESAESQAKLTERVVKMAECIQAALKRMRCKISFASTDNVTLLNKIVRFRKTIEQDKLHNAVLFNDAIPPMPIDLYNEDEESLYISPSV